MSRRLAGIASRKCWRAPTGLDSELLPAGGLHVLVGDWEDHHQSAWPALLGGSGGDAGARRGPFRDCRLQICSSTTHCVCAANAMGRDTLDLKTHVFQSKIEQCFRAKAQAGGRMGWCALGAPAWWCRLERSPHDPWPALLGRLHSLGVSSGAGEPFESGRQHRIGLCNKFYICVFVLRRGESARGGERERE